MSNIVFGRKQKIDPLELLKLAGYTYRPQYKDWYRVMAKDARYHVKRIDHQTLDIHIDIYTDTTHFAAPMPKAISKERRKILRKIKYLQNGKKSTSTPGTHQLL